MVSFIKSAVYQNDYPIHNLSEVVIVGRSNVGKSSFINSCFKQKIAHIGKTPGKTKLLNFFNIDNKFVMVDVPGYGYAKISQKELLKFGEMMENYFNYRKQLKLMIMIVDSRHKPTNDDLMMMEFARYNKLKVLVIANKIDKLKQSEIKEKLEIIKDTLNISKQSLIPYSSLSNFKQKEIKEIIYESL